jgi:integrase
LTAILYKHLATFGTDAEGRLFSSQRGGPMPAITYRLVWKAARETVFGVEAAKTSLLAKRPYDLRHAAVSTWLSGGVEPKRVADWAGHSPEILMKVYAKVLDGGEDAALDKIDVVLGT